ncbi:hypothetical protein KR018_012425 [Drosophila ironensis]|nr:hypothetical protein KR018_012425 [Drosophila ironensis]
MEMFFRCVVFLIYSTGVFSARHIRIKTSSSAELVKITFAPWQASLQFNGQHLCGACIYSDNIVLTAASCISGKPYDVTVRVGTKMTNTTGQVVKTLNYFIHDNYNSATKAYDVAVIRLQSKLHLSPSVRTIAIADVEPKPKTPAILTGWGSNPQSPILMATTVNIVNRQKCNRTHGDMKDVMLCASTGASSRILPCGIDLGGPVVINNKLVGIVSLGYNCETLPKPLVLTNVVKLSQWIKTASDNLKDMYALLRAM